jgi:histone-lysine N-methyltransferase SETMAR
MLWDALPHPACSPDLAPSDFHLFGPLKEAVGGKRFRANDEVKLSVRRWLDKQQEILLEGT